MTIETSAQRAARSQQLSEFLAREDLRYQWRGEFARLNR